MENLFSELTKEDVKKIICDMTQKEYDTFIKDLKVPADTKTIIDSVRFYDRMFKDSQFYNEVEQAVLKEILKNVEI